MALNLALVYRPHDDPAQPLFWFNLASNPQHTGVRGDFVDFHHWRAKKQAQTESRHCNLYLFLAQELISLHQVDVTEGVKRNLQKLLPVLLEEQIAQDIDEIAVHYVDAIPDADSDALLADQPFSNTAVWDKNALAELIQALKNPVFEQSTDAQGKLEVQNKTEAPSIRIKACLPISASHGLDEQLQALEEPQGPQKLKVDLSALLPRVPEPHRIALVSADDGEPLNLQLENHRWNLISPEQNELSPLYGVSALAAIAAGLYLLNQWLAAF